MPKIETVSLTQKPTSQEYTSNPAAAEAFNHLHHRKNRLEAWADGWKFIGIMGAVTSIIGLTALLSPGIQLSALPAFAGAAGIFIIGITGEKINKMRRNRLDRKMENIFNNMNKPITTQSRAK